MKKYFLLSLIVTYLFSVSASVACEGKAHSPKKGKEVKEKKENSSPQD